MNNIYVDGELPKSCNKCKLGYFYDCQYCFLRPDLAEKDEWCEKEKHCPLKPLTEALAEERKRVCEQIYQLLTNESMWKSMKDWWLNNGTCIELKKVLDAVEKETPNQEIIKKFGKDREYYALLDNLREQLFLVLNKNELDKVERGE